MFASKPDFLAPILATGVKCSWVNRVEGVQVEVERKVAIERLRTYHDQAVREHGGFLDQFYLCEQTHSNVVKAVERGEPEQTIPIADGLITNEVGLTLGVFVADCGAIYISDSSQRAVGVIHSGRVGTEKNIIKSAVESLQREYGCKPENLVVALGPCIRPPAYEVDFASQIKKQAMEAGVIESNYHDSGICTTSDSSLYYSYRNEQGKTGRMLALISL